MRYPAARSNEDFLKNWYTATTYGTAVSYGYHEGDDFNLKTGGNTDLGQTLYAIADGEVSSVHSHSTGFGNHVHIYHPKYNVWSHYAHCQSIKVKVGDVVHEGEVIGTLGTSGNSQYAHLHFAIKNQPTGIDGIAKTLDDLKKWENPSAFIAKHVSSTQEDMSEELKACLAQHKDLIDQLEAQKKVTTTAQTALGEERIKHQETKTELDLVKKELDDEEDEHTTDLEKIAVLLDVSPEMSAILPAIETCITYEDKANKADKALQEAKAEYDLNLKQAAKTVDDLKKQVIALEQKIVQLQNEKPDSGVVVPTKSIWDLIVEFFTRKQL